MTSNNIALVPMGFCYPGRGNGGDLPPRPECAATWRKPLLSHLQNIELTIAVGRYAIDWHLQPSKTSTLTDIVRTWQDYAPEVVPLPHPSPRNTRWLQRNPWVEAEIVPYLQQRVKSALGMLSRAVSRIKDRDFAAASTLHCGNTFAPGDNRQCHPSNSRHVSIVPRSLLQRPNLLDIANISPR